MVAVFLIRITEEELNAMVPEETRNDGKPDEAIAKFVEDGLSVHGLPSAVVVRITREP